MMSVMTHPYRYAVVVVLAALPAVGCAAAQTVPGLWGSPLYRVQLNVSGSTLSGTFVSLDTPDAPTGKIVGKLLSGGKGFTATWTVPSGADTATFSTYLAFAAGGSLLTGYRWHEDSDPAAFALHRAVNGQVPDVVGPDDIGSAKPGGNEKPPTVVKPKDVGDPKPGGNTPPPKDVAAVAVTICEAAPGGQPQNVANDFTAPKRVTALLKHSNLSANTSVKFVWTRDGKSRAES